MPLDLTSFAIKWQQTQLTERSAYQQHFRDLCEALGVPHPTEEDVVGNDYTVEKHVTKTSGGKGFANVWKRDAFAFEYKLPGGDLKKAYSQLIEHHEDLGNPPLLIVCDFKAPRRRLQLPPGRELQLAPIDSATAANVMARWQRRHKAFGGKKLRTSSQLLSLYSNGPVVRLSCFLSFSPAFRKIMAAISSHFLAGVRSSSHLHRDRRSSLTAIPNSSIYTAQSPIKRQHFQEGLFCENSEEKVHKAMNLEQEIALISRGCFKTTYSNRTRFNGLHLDNCKEHFNVRSLACFVQ